MASPKQFTGNVNQTQQLILTVIISLAISFGLFYKVFGSPANFQNGHELVQAHKTWVAEGKSGAEPQKYTAARPLNFFGILYKGGILVPISMSIMLVMVIHTLLRLYNQKQLRRR